MRKAKALDYSKWDHIEISDDEDDTHPNIDTPHLFEWRHQARVERMSEMQKEKDDLKTEKKSIEESKKKLMNRKAGGASKKDTKAKLEKLKRQEEKCQKKEEELLNKEKVEPWNIDTICRDGFSKSSFNKDSDSEEDEVDRSRKAFAAKYDKDLKAFGNLTKLRDSRKYLQSHSHLLCDDACNEMVIWCLNLVVEEKLQLMETVAHQTVMLQVLLGLARTFKVEPRDCLYSFFTRIRQRIYMENFLEELASFKERVKQTALNKLERVEKEEQQKWQTFLSEIENMFKIEKKSAEDDDDDDDDDDDETTGKGAAKKIGPGGLDPKEVFETLPKEMQECFRKRNLAMLQTVVAALSPDKAKYHMKRCVDSGLWVPDKENQKKSKGEQSSSSSKT